MNTASRTRFASAPLALLAFLALCGAAGVRLVAGETVTTADARVADRLMQWRNRMSGPPASTARIVHIDLDDRSAEMFVKGEPGRAEFAAVMRAIGASGAAAQVYDFVFAGQSAAGDDALAAAARASSHVYIGTLLGFEGHSVRRMAGDGRSDAWEPDWTIAPSTADGAVRAATFAMGPYGELARAASGAGFLNVEADPDGVFRRVPLVAKYRDRYYPGLALRVVCGYLGVPADRVVVNPGASVTLPGARLPDGRIEDLVIPIDGRGAMRLDFRHEWAGFRHFSMGELWRDSMDPTAAASWRDAVNGRIAMVSEIATTRGDVGPTPIDSRFPLAGLHSTAILNILEGRYLRAAPGWVEAAAVLVAILAMWGVALWLPRWLWAAGIVTLVGALGASAAMLVVRGVLVPVALTSLVTVAFVIAAGTWRFVDAAREREFTRRAFEAYFPPAVVARLVAARGRLSAGARKDLTILFSDIVGFTARSATMSPEDVQVFLNGYFTSMVEIVFEHGGTVDKFIGDGLMVFFNDPDDQPDHAERAVRCALAMQERMRAMHRDMQIRIGVNTGPAIVGNMGATRRLSYTALGASVNLAQRLESAAPHGGVLLSASTAGRLPASIPVSDAGLIHVKGFDAPVHVFVASAVREAIAV